MSSKPEWLYRQAAAIPLFGERIVLVTSRKKRWVLPKGVIDPGLTPTETAAKEALEEAGVVGRILPDELGRYQYKKWGGVCTVRVFELEVEKLQEDWEEKHFRDRRLVAPAEAVELVDEEELTVILRRRFGLER